MENWYNIALKFAFIIFLGLEILHMTHKMKILFATLNQTGLFPGDGKPQSVYLDSSVFSHRIGNLTPKSAYDITIHAVYSNSEGPESSLSQLTGTSKIDQLDMIYAYMNTALSHGVIASSFRLSDLEVMYFGLFILVTINNNLCHFGCYHLVGILFAYSKYSPLTNNRFLVSSQHI